MKILNVNSYYLSSSLYKPMEDSLLNIGFEIITYVPVYKGYKGRKEIDFELPDYVNISKCYKKRDRLFFHLKHHKIKKDFFQKVRVTDYDILHAHSLFSNGYIAYKAFKKYQIPYIVAVRSTDINVFFKKMIHLRKLGINILMNAKKIIFLSEPHKEECLNKYIPQKYKKRFLNKTCVIPNGIDDFWLKNTNKNKLYFKNNKIKLLYVGVINKNKNILTTIEAIKQLKQNGYDVQFTVVGRVIDRNIFNKIIKYPFLQYIEPMPKEDLIQIYRENDIFVMPSIHETFGLVYAEALSQGLPVIYSKGQGFDRQFSEGEVGYAVDALSPSDIANKIQKIILDYDKISNKCIQLVEKFSWKNISEEYSDLYIQSEEAKLF